MKGMKVQTLVSMPNISYPGYDQQVLAFSLAHTQKSYQILLNFLEEYRSHKEYLIEKGLFSKFCLC